MKKASNKKDAPWHQSRKKEKKQERSTPASAKEREGNEGKKTDNISSDKYKKVDKKEIHILGIKKSEFYYFYSLRFPPPTWR